MCLCMCLSQWRSVFLRVFFKEDRHFSIDTSHKKYILLQNGNISKIMFLLKEKTL